MFSGWPKTVFNLSGQNKELPYIWAYVITFILN